MVLPSAQQPFPGAIVLHVYDNSMNGPVKFYVGIIADVVFNYPDGSATEANGFAVVKLTERAWQEFYGRYCRKARVDLGGQPVALNADGTIA